MLVLRRLVEERIVIDVPPSLEHHRVELLVMEIGREDVRLGFDAPRCIAINRKEILEGKDGAK